MRVTQKLAISAQDFFSCVIQSVIHDIKEQTGKTLTRKQLAGFVYQKKMREKQNARVKITKIIDNQEYAFTTYTSVSEFEVCYTIKEIDETHCEVTYEENVTSHEAMRTLNDKIVGSVVGFFRKRNVKKLLHAIEKTATVQ